MSTYNPYIRVDKLRELLAGLNNDDLLRTLTIGQTGDLPIIREGVQVAAIRVTGKTSEIQWWSRGEDTSTWPREAVDADGAMNPNP